MGRGFIILALGRRALSERGEGASSRFPGEGGMGLQPWALRHQPMLPSAPSRLSPSVSSVCSLCAADAAPLCSSERCESALSSLPECFARMQHCGGGRLCPLAPVTRPWGLPAPCRSAAVPPGPPTLTLAQLCAVPGAGQVVSCCCAFRSESPSHSSSARNALSGRLCFGAGLWAPLVAGALWA